MPVQATQVRSLDQEQPRGDQSAPTLIANPFGRSPAPNNDAEEYENGYTFGESIDVKVIGTLPPAQWAEWAGRAAPWREGFAAALRGVGLGRFAGNLESNASKESSMKLAFTDFLLGGPGYTRGQNARLQELLGAGLISKDEADSMRGDVLDAGAGGTRGLGYGALGATIGAGAGALVGALPGGKPGMVNRARSIANNAAGGAALGGALGWYGGAREAGKRHVDRDYGNMVEADPSRAEPQFTPNRTPAWGRAAIGAGIGAAIGGLQGKGVKREYPGGKTRSYAIPGLLAGAALGGAAAYKNPVTSTTPKKPEGESSEKKDEPKKEEPKKESEFWASELRALKTAGMGSDIIGGGAGAVASGLAGGPVMAPLAAGVSGSRLGRSSYADEHPEFTDRERAAARGAGGLGSGLLAVGVGGLGAALGSELGSMGADELTEHGLADGSVHIPGMTGGVGIHEALPAAGAVAGGLGAADLFGRRNAADAVTRHRADVALRAAKG